MPRRERPDVQHKSLRIHRDLARCDLRYVRVADDMIEAAFAPLGVCEALIRPGSLGARHSSDASCGVATSRTTRHFGEFTFAFSGAHPAHERLGQTRALTPAGKTLRLPVAERLFG